MELDVRQRPVLLPAHGGEVIGDAPDRRVEILSDAEPLAATWTRYGPHREGADLHVHRHHTDLFYVLEGELTVRLGDHERVLGPGETAWLPRGIAHTFRIDSPEARLLEISTPAGFEQFHVELGEPAAELRIPDPAPLDVAAMAAGSARHGCDIVGPPMDPA